jgi:two-component system LytT family sensor kinase
LPAQFHKRSGGIGLVNVRRRLDLLYPKKYDLSIEDSPTTYGDNLEIDLV